MSDFILPHALPGALDGFPQVKLLSLDCFDTLLWRDCHAPRDLFGALPGTTVQQRQWAEQRARTAGIVRRLRNEVTIDEIYRELLPAASAAERSAAIRHELDAEAAHCFAFVPTVELMRAARRRGIDVVIVSDTYLHADQLRELIARAAGEDVAALIGRIFCSSQYRTAKAEGLYRHVLKELPVGPDQILHIGDNANADVKGVAPFGVNTLHLRQFTHATEQRLRLESSASAMIESGLADVIANHQPHRAALAAVEPLIEDAAEAFGFTAIGPVLAGFERWLTTEAEALAAERGGTVHRLFMMRDGELPRRVHDMVDPGRPGHAIEISRFTAIGASFRDEKAVGRYLDIEVGGDLHAVAKQLLLPEAEARQILAGLPHAGRAGAFLKAIRNPARMRRIVRAGRGLAERLVAHVRATVNPVPGDTLMMVDLGYNGSVQNEIDALLRDALGVHVAGRYLLLREQFRSGLDKRGFIGPDHYDANTLEAMCGNVAVLEQICTAAQGSVVDYATDGTPVRKANSIKARQSATRERIQAGCLRFAATERTASVRADMPDAAAMWRRGAAAVLGRLMFLPLPRELEVVSAFEHDVNLGVDDTVALFDPAIARRGLRQRGLFYMKGSERMYLPAELDGEGLALKLSLFAHRRFGLPLKYADFVDRSIALPVLVADGHEVSEGAVTATPTHDGYFLAPVPVGDSRYTVGIQFGKLYEWLQIESATFMPVDQFLSDRQRPGTGEVEALPTLEGMDQTAPHLFHCADAHATLIVPPPPRTDDRAMMLAVVFRPIAPRQAALARATAATPADQAAPRAAA